MKTARRYLHDVGPRYCITNGAGFVDLFGCYTYFTRVSVFRFGISLIISLSSYLPTLLCRVVCRRRAGGQSRC
jgi:hypothetical protein